MANKKNPFVKQPQEIELSDGVKIYLKKPKMTFMLKYLGIIQQIPEILNSGKRMETESGKLSDVIEKILSYAVVDEKGQRIIGDQEGRIPFEDFDPDADWDLLKSQGIDDVYFGDVAFCLFFYLMKEIGQFKSKVAGDEIESFPDKSTGD